jgi:hypothetical protein
MSIFFGEFFLSLAAAGVFVLLLISTGTLFARLFRFPGYETASAPERYGIALLCALAILPILLDFAGRVSPKAIPLVAVMAIVAGLPDLARSGCPLPKTRRALWLAAVVAWVVVSLALIIDWPDGSGGLTHSLTALDYVKHSETTWAVAQTGTPPINPTYYLAEGRASYYYFFYTLTAAVSALSGWFFGAEPRHAAYAAAPIAGFALFALMHLLWSRARCDEAVGAPTDNPRPGRWIAALLLTSGPDILFMLHDRMIVGEWPLFPEVWSQQVTSWLDSALWVPHHVAGLAAAFAGLLALAASAAPDKRHVLFSGLAFASMAGMSIYVAMGAALTAAFWLCALAFARRFADALRLVAAGGLSAVFAAPWILSVVGRISDQKAAIAVTIRNSDLVDFSTGSPAGDIAVRLFVMIAIYGANFGVFALGAHAFWSRAGRKGLQGDVALLLALGAASSILIGSFFESVILQNDLGWRIMLFAQAATFVWTMSALHAGAFSLRSPAAGLLLALGYVSVAYGALQMRLAPWRIWPTELERAADLDEKSAWEWVNANTPEEAVVQARPNRNRAYEFGLYARRRAAVADIHVGQLFGAAERAVVARVVELRPIFENRELSPDQVNALAARYDIRAIVVNESDPVFEASGAWTQKRAPAFSAPRARVYLTPGARP